ncbi:hypothetical protein LINGRAHAP2_LOCUS17352 [Linum grandiflorum]
MKGATRLPWIEAGEVDIRNEGGNTFVFTFSKEELREAIWSKRPWVIASSFLNLKKWDRDGELRNIPFQTADLWINIHNLPPQYKSIENVKVVGNLYFQYINCDRAGLDQGRWRRYIRAFVEVRIDESLQILGELPTEGKELLSLSTRKLPIIACTVGEWDIRRADARNARLKSTKEEVEISQGSMNTRLKRDQSHATSRATVLLKRRRLENPDLKSEKTGRTKFTCHNTVIKARWSPREPPQRLHLLCI